VTVFSQDPAPDDASYSVVLLPSTRHLMGFQSAPLTFPFQIARCDFSQFDLIHAQGDDQWVRRSKSPAIVRTMHGASFEEAIHNGWRAHSVKRSLLHLYFYACEFVADLRADKVIAVSDGTRRYFPRVHEVIGNGVEIERFSACDAPKSAQPSVLFVGEIDSRKRGSLLLTAFRNVVRPQLPNAEAWFVSPDSVEAEGVKCFGAVSSERLVDLYRRAWVFCLPSSYEGFGRPYVEAMAAGTAVVATHNAGADEVLERGRYGLLVRDAELGDSLLSLLQDESRRRQMAVVGLERAQQYSWDRIAERYEAVYESVLKQRVRQECHA
jgi:phosphatidyl-myo-inositol alpha-mannosyltransferase